MKRNVTILGAGITGASLGCFLSRDEYNVNIIDKAQTVGGLAKSFKYRFNGAEYTLDYGPHKLYSQIPGIIDEYKNICNNNIRKVEKHNSIFIQGKPFSFPVKMLQLSLGINPVTSLKLGLGFALAQTGALFSRKDPKTYEEYFIRGFGRQAYELLFRDLASKVWGSPETLSSELAQKRVPVPNVWQLLKSSSGKDSSGNELSAKHFYYPITGGCGYVTEAYAKETASNGGHLLLSTEIKSVSTSGGKITSIELKKDGKTLTISPDFLVSSIYLKDLLSAMNPKPPQTVMKAVNGLKYRSLILVYLFVKKSKTLKDNWVFFPEKNYIFNRLAELNSFSPSISPKGHSVITAEITCEYGDDIYSSDDAYVYRRVMDDVEKSGLFGENVVEGYLVRKSGRVYPVYDIHYRKNLQTVLDYLDGFSNLITLGRQGLYNYNNTDHCIDMSLKAEQYINSYYSGTAEKMNSGNWKKIREYFDTYRIVD